jgi:D-3-phosphoglycerate dehydrogenase / 2-oxoglutarate reductase
MVAPWTVVSTSPSFGRYSEEPLERLRAAGCEVKLVPRDDRASLLDALGDAHAWIAGFEPVGAETLDGAPRMRVVAKCGAGMDNFDRPYLQGRGIAAVNVPGGNSGAVAEWAIAQLLALARGTIAADRAVRAGRWAPVVGAGLEGRTLGVVGLGRIGRRVADLARAFGMHVLAHDPGLDPGIMRDLGASPVTVGDLFNTADSVSLHVPLVDATRGLVGAAELDLLGPRGYLVSCSRGGVVDEAALLAALHGDRIAGAALDVFATEPLPADSPLRDAPNLLLSPHTAGYSDTALAEVTLQCADNVLAALGATP